MTIDERQAEIVEEFELLDGDMEMTVNYIMELGERLEDLPADKRTDDFIVKGCQSKVWLWAFLENDKLVFQADSNTAITKGLVYLLIRTFSGQSPEDILDATVDFPSKIGMNRFIGTQRSNGFAAMIKQMKMYALALHNKVNI